MHDDDTTRDPFEALAAEFVERRRSGENPSIDEYVERCPELADEIRELFPTIGAIEELQETEVLPQGGTAHGDLPFDVLGDYRIIRELGRGGMGIVYEAEQVSLARHVAVKVLPRSHVMDAVHLERFRREARLAARLHHTNIVPVFGVGEQEGYHYYVMQLIRGIGLDRAIARLASRASSGPPRAGDLTALARHDSVLPADETPPSYWHEVARIGFCVADALAHAHALGTLHRDIKPANLLLDEQGDVWVADFGLAKAVHADHVTRSGGLTGTLRYMAPEQFEGHADARTDIYSVGITLYELLTLRPAFAQTDRSRLMHQIVAGSPPAPRKVNPSVPRDLETIVLKATAREPRRRYGSAEELARDLERFLDGRPVQARRVTALERAWRWCGRNPALASVTTLAAGLVVAVAVVASIGYARTRRALRAEARQRQRAEANAESAVTVLDAVFRSFSPGEGAALTVQGSTGAAVTLSAPAVLSPQAATLLTQLLSFYEQLAEQEGQGGALRGKVADAHRRVADIRRRLGQYDEALAAYNRAIAVTQALPPDVLPADARALELAELHNGVGQLYKQQHHFEESQQSHRRALAILERCEKLSDRGTVELARTHCFLGTAADIVAGRPLAGGDDGPVGPMEGPPFDGPPPRRGTLGPPHMRPRLAAGGKAASVGDPRHLEQAIALLEPFVAQHPEDGDARCLLARSLREYSKVLHARGDEAAIVSLERAIAILEALVKEHPESPDYRYDLCLAYTTVDPRQPVPRRWSHDTVQKQHLKALRIAESLAAERPQVPQYALLLATIYHRAALVSDREEARTFQRSAVDTCSRLVSRFPHVPNYRAWEAAMQIALARSLLARRELDEASRTLDAAVAALKKLRTEHAELTFVSGLLEEAELLLDEALGIPPGPGPRP